MRTSCELKFNFQIHKIKILVAREIEVYFNHYIHGFRREV